VVAGSAVVGDITGGVVVGGVVVRGIADEVLGDAGGGTVFFVTLPPQAAVKRATSIAAVTAQRRPLTTLAPDRRQ
jgi:hypothetical protein